MVSEYPQKEFYRLNEVCRYTDTQPYVLRFWESEFPQLKPARSGSGQPVYRREDIDLVRRIKQLLYDEECSLEAARQELDKRRKPTSKKKKGRGQAPETPSETASSSAIGRLRRDADKSAARGEPASKGPVDREVDHDVVSRRRYDDAVEEVNHLRLQVKEAEKARRKAEDSLEAATAEGERHRLRAVKAGERIEALLETLS